MAQKPIWSIINSHLLSGLAGYLAGVTVAVKQVMPDHILYRSPVGKITNRNVPLTLFATSFVLWAVGLVEGSYCTMFFTGLLVAWIYLRFYQVSIYLLWSPLSFESFPWILAM